MLKHLSIQHYRSIGNLDLELSPVTVFVGPNGVGKSNIIDAIAFVRDAVKDGLDKAVTSRHGFKSVRQWSPSKPYNVSIMLEHANKYNKNIAERDGKTLIKRDYKFVLSSSKDNYRIISEEANWYGKEHYPIDSDDEGYDIVDLVDVSFNFSRNKYGKLSANWLDENSLSRVDDDDLFMTGFQYNTHSYTSIHLTNNPYENYQRYIIYPNTLRTPQTISKDTVLSEHGENISSVIKRLRKDKNSSAFKDILTAMKKIMPDLEDIRIATLGSNIVPRFLVHAPNSEKSHYYEVDQVSDGTLRLLGILVALYQTPGPQIVALEEPEQTVHPGALPLIAEAIKEVSSQKQVLITSHSPEFLDLFEPEDIVAVEYENGETVARPLAEHQVEAVKDNLFSLGELMAIEGLHG